ncbi:MAG: DUF2778 domain-containing protein [Xanthomonadales bacterium]|nr:DUF2778 domain-containing protein [Xanthomonadales bacterium]MCP5476987.1 DUF2778 domain-containing protein [Rhodanobacteraceae bacterium]
MWTYVQDTGAMFDPQGVQLEKGYAGKDPHKNHPDSQCVKDLGPIPRGDYRIRAQRNNPTPVTLPLDPDPGNFMCKPLRSGFLIHGDSIAAPGTASNGCIILSRAARIKIRDSGDDLLRVVRDDAERLALAKPPAVAPLVVAAMGTATPGAAPSASSYELHPDAQALILEHEGVNQPGKWPGGRSGITIGYGYDLGYRTRDQFESAWQPHLATDELQRLSVAIGRIGPDAQALALSLKSIRISQSASLAVFVEVMIDAAWSDTLRAFPKARRLPSRAQGALLSLVLNRGASLVDKPGDDRRREMREIRVLCDADMDAADRLRGIAAQLRSMKRIWQGQGLGGLLRRREDEARLVERAITDL